MDDLKVTIRASMRDPYAGLRGKDYIAARGLTPQIGRIRAESIEDCQCAPCVRERMLPAVQRICAAYDRRQIGSHVRLNWSIDSPEALLALTEHPELESV
ncbi:hypothetical protein EDC30_104266 [Paucimonas lemoignei]|uniref:Uncharacterized protein n=1 Tax=Paucimonas lemoignei TaxID=29443 RepID=A0A4R3HWD7_PAULE|nr:hypothetical protein [Paucimonas lemoignei]TCS37462.1 hypothetical protein EDC30_104266 [Paucimonas lemoignei]